MTNETQTKEIFSSDWLPEKTRYSIPPKIFKKLESKRIEKKRKRKRKQGLR